MNTPQASRVDWVDYAKGFCIIMVVMMHSTLGVEQAAGREGWMHAAVAFARPFRMPDFFLISGLFLARVIDRDWRDYLDRKVVHFAYFYVLWVTIQFAFKAPMFAADMGWRGVGLAYLEAFIEPFGTLWFIYLLPIFFVVVKLTRGVPWLAIWLVGAALEIAHIDTGWTVIDEFAQPLRLFLHRLYLRAAHLRARRRACSASRCTALAGLAVWARHQRRARAGAAMPTGRSSRWRSAFVGAGAVVAVAALMARSDVFRPLRYCGQNSIVIYLAFFLPMAATRIALLKTGIITDLGTISLLVTAAGVVGALAWYWAVRGTPLRFLFERPAWARLKPARVPAMQPAE